MPDGLAHPIVRVASGPLLPEPSISVPSLRLPSGRRDGCRFSTCALRSLHRYSSCLNVSHGVQSLRYTYLCLTRRPPRPYFALMPSGFWALAALLVFVYLGLLALPSCSNPRPRMSAKASTSATERNTLDWRERPTRSDRGLPDGRWGDAQSPATPHGMRFCRRASATAWARLRTPSLACAFFR